MIRQHTLTDYDGDRARFFTVVGGSIFVTVSTEDTTVTAGGFTRDQLGEALDAVAPAGDSTDHETTGEALARLQTTMARLLDEADAELRDEADGGVAAALIEKEAEEDDAAGARPLTPNAMTAREHLDAARNAGHPLPKGATIPEGAAFWVKAVGESWEFVPEGPHEDFNTSPFPDAQYVLVDPPTPARPEGAEELEAILADLPDTMLPATDAGRADLLASRGVRAPEPDDRP